MGKVRSHLELLCVSVISDSTKIVLNFAVNYTTRRTCNARPTSDRPAGHALGAAAQCEACMQCACLQCEVQRFSRLMHQSVALRSIVRRLVPAVYGVARNGVRTNLASENTVPCSGGDDAFVLSQSPAQGHQFLGNSPLVVDPPA